MASTSIQFIQRSGLLVLHIPAKAGDSDFSAIPDLLGEKLGDPGTPPLSGIVVDFKDAGGDLNEAAWKKMTVNLTAIPGKNRFFVVGVPAATQKLITSNSGGISVELFASVDEVFSTLSTRRAASPKASATATKQASAEDLALEKLMIATFQEAAAHTLEVQCSTVFKPGEPFVKNQQNKIIHDIAASMGLMSKGVSGSVALGFKESTFLKIMSKMLGEQYTAISSEVEDGCGELLNIIFGQAKKALAEKGHQFGKTLPTIFIGQSLHVRQLTPNPAFILPFESELGQMVIELGYRKT